MKVTSDQPTNKRDWNLIYRWVVICIFALQLFGTGVGIYAAKAYVQQVATDTVQVAVAPLVENVAANTKAVQEFKAFKDQGPRFTSEGATILRSQAVAEAVKISSDHVAKLEAKLDETNRQIVEVKILLARLQPKDR